MDTWLAISILEETDFKAKEWGPVIHRLWSRKSETKHYEPSTLIGDGLVERRRPSTAAGGAETLRMWPQVCSR